MRFLIILPAFVALAVAKPGHLVTPYAYASPAVHAYAAPSVASSQYHAQDELGQYSYGYAGGPSAKHEVKTFDGVTRGGYSYVDANGIVQTVNYIADPVHGFRVAATNLPVAPIAAPAIAPVPVVANLVAPLPVQDTPEVAAAKIAHLAAVNEAKVRASVPSVAIAAPAVSVVAPAHVAVSAPLAYAAPALASSQYHAQDELGQYSYGYAGGPSTKHEVKTFDGVTRGGYSYIDSNGIVQTVNYIADPVNGFRVAATNLPVAPAAGPAQVVPQHVYLQDAPDVAIAKAAHFAAHAEAKARL